MTARTISISTLSPSGEKPNDDMEKKGVAAGLYVRVSTQMQAEKESLSTQESRLRAYCLANGIEVRDVYRDKGISAKDTKRPELERLMEDCRRGRVRAVLVTALDRITRSLRDLHKLVDFFAENNVRFISITQNIDSSSAFGRFMRDLLGLIAQLERGVVAERVANDMHHRASLGKWNGGMVPYGYTTFQRIMKELKAKKVPEEQARKKASRACPEPKRLYKDPEEAEVVGRIFETFINTRSLRRTAHTLNSLGINTRTGKTWAVSTVHKILTSPVCTGKISYGKTRTDLETGKLKNVTRKEWKVVKGQHEPIVPDKLFRKAQDILKATSRKPTRASHGYLLSGLLRCGKCSGPMYGQTFEKRSSGKAYSYYKCVQHDTRGSSVCSGLSVPAGQIEDFVVRTLTDLSKDKPFLQEKGKVLSLFRKELKPQKGKETLERLKKRERELEARKDTLLEKLESRLISDFDFKKRYDALEVELRDNRLERERALDSADYSAVAYEALNASFEEIGSFGKNWEFLDNQGKAAKISAIVKKIKVNEDGLVNFQLFLDKVEEPSTAVSRH